MDAERLETLTNSPVVAFSDVESLSVFVSIIGRSCEPATFRAPLGSFA